MKTKYNILERRKWNHLIMLMVVAAAFVLCSGITDFDLHQGLSSLPRAAVWMGSNLIPDAKAFTRLPRILSRLLETALLSVAVTMTAATGAFFFSLIGSDITKTNGVVKMAVRTVAAFFRNVPDVVWAILLMFSFGQNVLTGFFALFLTTFGLMTRAFIETIDEVSGSCVEALTSAGAGFMQIIFQGVVPSSAAGLLTWILYMIETNIRSSTLIGILTATGIGYMFDLYYKRLEYATASLVVISVVVLVVLIETISNKLRSVII